MTMRGRFDRADASTAAAAAGVRHVLLTYHYRDIGDLEGLASLLADDVRFEQPGRPTRQGRSAVLEAHGVETTLHSQHELELVVAEEDVVVVRGRVVDVRGRVVDSSPGSKRTTADGMEFVDLFTVSEHGLVRSCRRYHYLAPVEHSGAGPGVR